jgi:predicted transcriptional regulator of viral defense system
MFMGFDQFRREVKAEVFDHQLLANYLRDLKKPRDKISSLVADGKIVRIKKGLYVFGENWRRAPLNLEEIANLIYGPSCVSFEYALSRYGLIPERSTVITSLALGDSKTFYSVIGVFEYRAISCEKFKVGIEYRNLGKEGGYFIASKEKALADLVYKTPGIRSLQHLRHYLFEEMRVDETIFRSFDFHKLNEIAKAYRKNSVTMMSQL